MAEGGAADERDGACELLRPLSCVGAVTGRGADASATLRLEIACRSSDVSEGMLHRVQVEREGTGEANGGVTVA